MTDHGQNLDRRRFLKLTSRGVLAAGAVPLLGSILAACGDDTAATTTTRVATTTTAGAPATTAAAPATTAAAPTTSTTTFEAMKQAALEAETGDLEVHAFAGTEAPEIWDYGYGDAYGTPVFTPIAGSFASLAKLQADPAGIDIWQACFAVFATAVDEGIVQPWDTSLIPNYVDLNPQLVDATQRNGEQFAIPLLYGLALVTYRTDLTVPAPNSYGALFDDAYAGKVSWPDAWGAEAYIVAGKLAENNVVDPLNPTDEEIERLQAFLIEKIRVIPRTLYADIPTNQTDLASGSIWVTYAAPTQWIELQKQGVDVSVVGAPIEGLIGFSCGYFLLADSDQYYHAHEWVNQAVSKGAAEATTNTRNFGNSNLTATDVDPLLADVFGLGDPSVLDGVTLLDKIGPSDVLNERWAEVKASA